MGPSAGNPQTPAKPQTRMRRMATVPRSAEAERHDPLLVELLDHVSAYNPDADRELIRAAFDYACDQHAGQVRKSGEAFVHHPWSVAVICALPAPKFTVTPSGGRSGTVQNRPSGYGVMPGSKSWTWVEKLSKSN